MSAQREGPTATLLKDGTVLVAGGGDQDNHPLQSAEIHDPVTDTWTPTPDMTHLHHYHTATLLRDGTVLVAGGGADAELYVP
jgi:hypothetical protein